MFPSPVAMAPGQTFVASYFAPTPSYAYQHDAFTGGGTVHVEQADSQADPAASLPIHFTATFNEPVNAFTGGVTLGGMAETSGATATVTQLSPTTYDIAVDGVTGSGTVTASLDAGATTDLAGNPSTASTSTDNSVDYAPGP